MITFSNSHHKKWVLVTYAVIIHVLALNGLVFLGVFVAIRLKLTNVSGSSDVHSNDYQSMAETSRVMGASTDTTISPGDIEAIDTQIQSLQSQKNLQVQNLCSLSALTSIAPVNVYKILSQHSSSVSPTTESRMIFSLTNHLENQSAFTSSVSECQNQFDQSALTKTSLLSQVNGSIGTNLLVWPDTSEWNVVSEAIIRDKSLIEKAAAIAGVEPRIIVANLMVEQMRLYYSQRALYKQYFEPLKILANSNKISLGIMSIKEETAESIESHLKDSKSPYYLGASFEHLLDYKPGENISQARYNRLTNNDHYYGYLYAALYIKQFLTQWERDGYPLNDRPEIIATLFNVGFPQSKPNDAPKVGGSSLVVNGNSYSFGSLAYEFYYSGELMNDFPILENYLSK